MECETGILFVLFSFGKEAWLGKLPTVRDKQTAVVAVKVLEQSGDSIKSNKMGKIGIKDSMQQRLETSYKTLQEHYLSLTSN